MMFNGKRALVLILTMCTAFTIVSCKNNNKKIESSKENQSEVSNNTGSNYAGSNVNSEVQFSLNSPSAKPNFTSEQIANQKSEGQRILNEIKNAAADLSKNEYVIPAGNFGFNPQTNVNGVLSGFVLSNINRPDDNPFTIRAEGVTFWFNISGKPCGNVTRAVHFVNCSNFKITGLTIDSYDDNAAEGVITQIDKANNRIEIKLSDGTMPMEMLLDMSGSESAILSLLRFFAHC